MKFTLSWLKEHLDTDEPVEKLADKLTMIGLEVEHIEDKAKALSAFTIARVISAEQHPNADRLRVCMVDTGNGAAPVQVVCGAPNARAGLVSVFSAPGTFIPGKNITLGVGTIRGVESRGMLCSAAELQLSEDHDGIMELPADAPIGAAYAQWAGLGDPMFEINLTPNRQDCTGVHGIARDLSAADMGKFRDPGIKQIKGEFPCPVKRNSRGRHAVSGLRAAAGARRQERPVAGMAAERAYFDRLAADQCAGRYHQLHDLRPRSAAACVRRGQSNGPSYRAPRPRRRNAAGARWPHLHARQRRLRHRRRSRRRIARRHHGRRSLRLFGSNHRRADRIGAVERDQHRADRPQARHQFGCALSLRARRRSGLHGAGAGDGHPAGDGTVRRHAIGEHRGRQRLRRRSRDRFSAHRSQAPGRASTCRWRR